MRKSDGYKMDEGQFCKKNDFNTRRSRSIGGDSVAKIKAVCFSFHFALRRCLTFDKRREAWNYDSFETYPNLVNTVLQVFK